MPIFATAACALILGIILGTRFGMAGACGCMATVILLGIAARWKRIPITVAIGLTTGMVLLGAVLSVQALSESKGPEQWPDSGGVWTASVCGMPRWGPGQTRFVVLSSWGKVQVTVPESMEIYPGDRVMLKGVPQRPTPPTNPGEFNYKAHLMRRRIGWVLWLEHKGEVQRLDGGGRSLYSLAARLSYRWQNIFFRTMPERDAGLLASLVLGQKDFLDPVVEEAITQVGLPHLLAVSGFHVGYAVLLSGALARLLNLKKKERFLVQMASTWIFAAVCGLQSGVVRAAIMVTGGLAARCFRRRFSPVSALSTAAVVILCGQPLFLFDPGFQLSFAAATALMAGDALLPKAKPGFTEWLQRALCLSVIVQIVLAPLIVYHYSRFVWTVPVTQIVAGPLIGIVIFLGLAAAWLGLIWMPLAVFIGACSSPAAGVFIALMESLVRFPYHGISVPTPSWWWMAIWYGLLIWLVRQRNFAGFFRMNAVRQAAVWLVLLAALFWLQHLFLPFPEALRVTALDVGQGDALVIQTRSGQCLLIDGGVRRVTETGVYDQGQRVVLPFLRQAGVNALDILFTHAHDDHIGGLISVARTGMVRNAWGPCILGETDCEDQLKSVLKLKGIPLGALKAGDTLQIGREGILEVLSPPESGIPGSELNLNDHSLVLLLTVGSHRMLFTGDLEAEGIRWLMTQENGPAADILKVPHHGADESMNRVWYRAVHPEYALISVGPNRYGHPGDTVTDYFCRESMLFRTDQSGAVVFRMFFHGIEVESFRGQ